MLKIRLIIINIDTIIIYKLIFFCSGIELMRNLRCYDVNDECPCDEVLGKVVNNYRPPLPLGNRELREYGHH